ncbi:MULTISPECIES: hypothetical protein [Xenorhabdus]|uniref:Uncharacterized protein n=1 Tax=Xenorhabdus khoisanae TaxID=880157 RepID=A0A0J5FRN4_9GAMM|nr:MULTISPECIES: hypothetical protein [Xenorhabdus]KLU17143.1 hypothetical protein AAY47_01620 [Xenorhabdus griffiniae]KMJ44961.1 hypothetical protein AB204_11495 [Xenorhabdus khoisanae]KOP32782.1 hypothetical protein AFK69_13840 [Xenorhabdus sp. GDc328]
MTEKQVKLTESSMRGYNGHLFMTEFQNGKTITPVSQRKQDRILATVRSEIAAKPATKELETMPPVTPPIKEPSVSEDKHEES